MLWQLRRDSWDVVATDFAEWSRWDFALDLIGTQLVFENSVILFVRIFRQQDEALIQET